MRILLMLFNQPSRSQKLLRRVALFHLLPHQASVQVCGLLYLLADLVLIFGKAVTSYYLQLGFSLAPLAQHNVNINSLRSL